MACSTFQRYRYRQEWTVRYCHPASRRHQLAGGVIAVLFLEQWSHQSLLAGRVLKTFIRVITEFGKNSTLTFLGDAKGAELPILDLPIQRPYIIARQIDVLPAQRGQVLQQTFVEAFSRVM